MRVGFSLPSNYAFSPEGNGVRAQARAQAAALERAGVDVVRLTPWEAWTPMDWIHLFMAGPAHHLVQTAWTTTHKLCLSPIIDSNASQLSYRLAAGLGALHGRVFTVPGIIREQAQAARLILCRSRAELKRMTGLGIEASKCRLVLNGVDVPDRADPEAVRRRFDLPREYALFAGAYTQPRKNVLRLLDAAGPTGFPLVLAGRETPGPLQTQIDERIERWPQIRRLGFVSEQELRGLQAGCKVFCLPSYHEGTGLAALEAAALGAQILITRCGGPPDYFGRYARYVDPHSTSDIRRQFEAALNTHADDRLQQHVRQTLTWDASAAQLLAAYRALEASP